MLYRKFTKICFSLTFLIASAMGGTLDGVLKAHADCDSYIRNNRRNIDSGLLGNCLKKLEAEVEIVTSNRESTEEDSLTAYKQLFFIYGFAANHDQKTFLQPLRNHVAKVRETFPESGEVAYGEYLLLDIRISNSNPSPELKAEVITYAQKYPFAPRDVSTIFTNYVQKVAVTDVSSAKELAGEFRQLLDSEDLEQLEGQLAQIGKPANLSLTAISGKKLDAASLKGKVVIIDVWATWCNACHVISPKLGALRKNNLDKVEVIGVSVDEDRATLDTFLAKHTDLSWPQVHMPFGGPKMDNFTKQYNLPHATPSVLVVNQKGEIASLILGHASQVEAVVSALLKNK